MFIFVINEDHEVVVTELCFYDLGQHRFLYQL